MKIEELGEFGLIARIRAALPEAGPNVIMGIGDDVAVLRAPAAGAAATAGPSAPAPTPAETVWLATCDVQVEGAHFLRDAIPPRSLGRKSLAINLSDIASAGGTPRYALVSLGLPAGCTRASAKRGARSGWTSWAAISPGLTRASSSTSSSSGRRSEGT